MQALLRGGGVKNNLGWFPGTDGKIAHAFFNVLGARH